MIKPQFFGYTSYAAYRAAFREKALRRNIDPAVGATSYQHVLLKAEQQTTTHFSRMSNAVWANANLESGWARYGGVIERIELMAGRDWWKDELFWNGRCAYVVPSKSKMPAYMYRLISLILPPDVSALANLRDEIGCDPKGTVASRFREVWEESQPIPVPRLHKAKVIEFA